MPTRTFLAGEENPVPGFKASKDRLTLVKAAGDFKLKPVLIYHSKIRGHLGIVSNYPAYAL